MIHVEQKGGRRTIMFSKLTRHQSICGPAGFSMAVTIMQRLKKKKRNIIKERIWVLLC